MKEHPILFSGPMVRAILDGHKTQTRRVAKEMQELPYFELEEVDGVGMLYSDAPTNYCGEVQMNSFRKEIRCPYGLLGDRLWVRETFRAWAQGIEYRADDEESSGWTPSIHMPRWACRLILEITGVRVERLQDITLEDAKAEGIPEYIHELYGDKDFSEYDSDTFRNRTTIQNFHHLWDSINAKRCFGWEANPWVWVIEFRRVE